jgi:two-component system, cell cycle sensor histidine kinase and response regulator CckA
LLTFGGREIVQPAVIEVKDVIDAMREMLDGSIGRQFLLRTDLAPDLWRIRADESQLCQVLLNLALNARDAMPGDGQLLIRARKWTGEVANLGPGEYVHIEVIDDGDGMAPEVVRQAIEPFFTTKPKGSGAGLGLATAYGIVKQAGGDLTIESTPGTGTTVHLYFPASDEPVEPVAPHVSPEAPAGRTILVAEDEDALREVAVRMLTSAGYRVLAAANGEEALAVARDNPEGIDAVLTDVVMPRMNGPELAQALRAVRPALPILYMSGYAAPLMTDQGLLEPGVTVLSKPFTKAELLDTLANCITV